MPQKTETKAEVAKARNFSRRNRSAAEQLKSLDNRLGKNTGAKKERARLIAQVAADELEAEAKKRKKKPE